MAILPNNTDGYCDPSDVARYFRTLEAGEGFTFDTNPTKEEVKSFIIEASERVDRFTGHAWRERQVTNEYHDISGPYYYWAGTPLKLQKREIRSPFDPEKGDKLEIWDGNEWDDWVSKDSIHYGRDQDYWINDSQGMLYVYRRSFWWERYKGVRVTYRYGLDQVPADVQQATAMFTAATLIETDIYGDLLPSGTEGSNPMQMAEKLEERAEKMIAKRKEIRTMGDR